MTAEHRPSHILENREVDPQHRNPVLLLGGGSGTGRLLAERLSINGYPVFVGTRSEEKFESIREEVLRRGGKEPNPFIADIKDERQVEQAVKLMGLSEGQTIDYFPFAAEGLQSIVSGIARPLIKLNRKLRETQSLTQEDALEATRGIRELVLKDSSMNLANQTNAEAPVRIAEQLVRRGNINKDSRIAVLSSMISKYTEADSPETYPGPWLYYPIGRSKTEGSQRLRTIAERTGAEFIDFVAPDIESTDVGEFFKKFGDVFEALNKIDSDGKFIFPITTKGHVVNSIMAELSKQTPQRIRDVYIPHDGPPRPTKPDSFLVPTIPYL